MKKALLAVFISALIMTSFISCQTPAIVDNNGTTELSINNSNPNTDSIEDTTDIKVDTPSNTEKESSTAKVPAGTAQKYLYNANTGHVGIMEADGTVVETGYYFQSEPIYQESTGRFFYSALTTPDISQEEFEGGMLQDTTGMDISHYVYYTDSLDYGVEPVEINETTLVARTDNFSVNGDNLLVISSYEEATLLNLTSKEKSVYSLFDTSSTSVFKDNKVYYNKQTDDGAAVYETDLITGETKELYSSKGIGYIQLAGDYVIIMSYGGVYDYLNIVTGNTGSFPVESPSSYLASDGTNYYFIINQYKDNPTIVRVVFDSSDTAIVDTTIAVPSNENTVSLGNIMYNELYLFSIIGPGESLALYKYDPETEVLVEIGSEVAGWSEIKNV